jgi:hypothetical protein
MSTTYVIHCEPGYFEGDIHGRDKPYILLSERDGRAIALASSDEAERIAAMMEPSGGVQLDDNQHSLPTYSVQAAPAGTAPMTMREAMRALDLHHDYREDGSRITA